MKKVLIISGLVGCYFSSAALAAEFSITVPAGSSQGTTNEQIFLQCSQMVMEQSLQMSCSLPGQTEAQKSQIEFAYEGKNVGSAYLIGAVQNTSVTAEITAPYQKFPPYLFTYTPSLQLTGWKANGDITLTCKNVVTSTPFCLVWN